MRFYSSAEDKAPNNNAAKCSVFYFHKQVSRKGLRARYTKRNRTTICIRGKLRLEHHAARNA